MINPFEVIEEQKKVIEDLKYKLKFSRNIEKDTKDINTLIHTIKCFDSMLVSKYKTDAVDKLLYALIYEILMINKAYESEIPLHDIIHTVNDAINYDAEFKKLQVISILKTHEMDNKIKNNTVFDKNYANFDALLKRLITEFKKNMVWTT